MKSRTLVVGLMASAFAALAQADINVGVSVSATGPAASLGIPEKNTFGLMPTTIAGQKVNYIVLDDATDPTTATRNARKLVGEHKVDALIGSTTTSTLFSVRCLRTFLTAVVVSDASSRMM